MKDINQMNLAGCLDALRAFGHSEEIDTPLDLADRIHDLTRWVSVSERLPTKDDADLEGYVLVRGVNNDGLIQNDIDLWNHIGDWNDKYWELTHWKRINLPETP
jgi:hypothetical protein